MLIKKELSNQDKNKVRRYGKFNKKLFIFSLPRSGKNAIMHWISSQSKLPVCIRSKNYTLSYGKVPSDFHFNLLISHHEWFTLKQINKIKNVRVLIIRDVYNWSAAWIKTRLDSTDYSLQKIVRKYLSKDHSNNYDRYRINLWKDYAKQLLSENSIFDIKISFNHWFKYKNYRKYIADLLGIKFTDKGINEIPSDRIGFGKSSFDKLKYQNHANKMNVLERYKYFKPELFNQILDSESIELNHKIEEMEWK